MDWIHVTAMAAVLLGSYLLWQFPRYAPQLEDDTGLVVEDGTPWENGQTAGERRAQVHQARGRSQLVGGLGLLLTMAGVVLESFFR